MSAPTPPVEHSRLWERPTTRRALLAGAATVAAAGTAVAIIGLVEESGGGANKKNDNNAGVPTTPKGVNLDVPIADERRRAAHLLRRAGFGGTLAEIEEFSKLTREQGADRLLNYQAADNSALDQRVARANFNLTTGGPGSRIVLDMQRWWLTRMAYTARPLEERMTLIWHGLLTSQVSKIGGGEAKLLVRQNELYRSMALGRYDDLVKATSKDPAMLVYLDNVESTKEHPNENYARELMELFTLGEGHYTENDIRESARAFTGWRMTPPARVNVEGKNLPLDELQRLRDQAIAEWNPQFLVMPQLHDSGLKTFMGKTGNFGGDDIVDIIMQQPQAGRFLAARLFTEFANYNPPDETVDRLAAIWESSGHSVREIVRAILVSDEFNSERSYRAFVRGPVELLVGAVRALQLETDFTVASTPEYKLMDQQLFEPPNVAGWPGGSTWLSSSTFYARANLLDRLLFVRNRGVEIPALASAATTEAMVDTTLRALVDGNVSDTARKSITDYASTIPNTTDRAAAIAYLVLASPEYQLI